MDFILQSIFTLLFMNNLTKKQYDFHIVIIKEMILKYQILDKEEILNDGIIKNRNSQYDIFIELYNFLEKSFVD